MSSSRNARCDCGSGRRFKECCGVTSDPYFHISTDVIYDHLRAVDDEGLTSGYEPKRRAFDNVIRVLDRLGINGVTVIGKNAPPIVRRIQAANDKLFRPQDKAVGGVHLGAYMFRDIFCRFHVPVIFGTPQLNFLQMTDLSDFQKKWLETDAVEGARFLDQAVDLLDFGLGWMEFGHGRGLDARSQDLIFRSHVQLEAAAAITTGSGDYRGAIQSSLLGVELALKAGLAAHGVGDDELRNTYRHNLRKAANRLQEFEMAFDGDRVDRVAASFPDYVQSRYAGPEPGRLETGHILMGAQYIASEVTRRFSDRDLRADHPEMPRRAYPA